MTTATVKQTETVNRDFVKARKITAKIARLGNMKASYRFRLAAMTAADNRPGKTWESVESQGAREIREYVENRQAIGAW